MIPRNNSPQNNAEWWQKGVDLFNALLVKLPSKIPWGFIIYFSFVVFILYSIYPNGNDGSGNVSEWFLAFFITVGLIVGIVLVIFSVKIWKKRKKEKPEKEKGDDKEKVKKAQPKVTAFVPSFWGRFPTWVMFFLCYVFLSMAWKMGFFDGSLVDMRAVAVPVDEMMFLPLFGCSDMSMLYVPYFGLLIAGLASAIILLLTESDYTWAKFSGFALAPLLSFYSFWNLWFMPFDKPHVVIIPALKWIRMSELSFPSDPQIPLLYIFIAIVGLLFWASSSQKINNIWLRVIILAIATAMFGQQWLIFLWIS